ncbi:4-(cytidine 5'-diphospho)-2-C-methyl-D-erythritol kinase [Chitinophaga sp. Cy-1792]|uniref:4-(cytidine 5'-diphospho)-2-C-methyl-D-erythritol kinase n=1 Tax=Chitinophaga sp. Cy-1792 TaxID=2608339 RepID=UPI0014216C30|nr:4-(cytidine 5'-diphospho)-2-C-methyl-D-erythritol kinase [Chitinophaga sp. Cy-1792]NIG56263.1 4-(cytidine 5'-diphospho)-2-C-methyl-D-erythritol kinase [Chitinophaga sp. Cy-1792]
MVVFPNCKINLGLNITAKRPDGFHDLETIFYPVPVKDALEVLAAPSVRFESSGIPIPGDADSNLCLKAYYLLKQDFPEIAPVQIHLHKHIPIGAGLGGGSSDAAFVLKLMNDKLQLGLDTAALINYAAQLGSDCPFFILNEPCFATGRGEILEPVALDLSGYSMLLVYPGIHVNTGWAFRQLTPQAPKHSLKELVQLPVAEWRGKITNDFELPVFESYPVIGQIKERMYNSGAVHASMSGSGSAVLGIFPKGAVPELSWQEEYQVFSIR